MRIPCKTQRPRIVVDQARGGRTLCCAGAWRCCRGMQGHLETHPPSWSPAPPARPAVGVPVLIGHRGQRPGPDRDPNGRQRWTKMARRATRCSSRSSGQANPRQRGPLRAPGSGGRDLWGGQAGPGGRGGGARSPRRVTLSTPGPEPKCWRQWARGRPGPGTRRSASKQARRPRRPGAGPTP